LSLSFVFVILFKFWILAAVVKVLGRAVGWSYSNRNLIHTTQVVEQVLTTGGGYQDQVGGLYGGFKVSWSKPALPLDVTTEGMPQYILISWLEIFLVIDVSEQFIKLFNSRLVLVYTGVQRLAKNLLVDVIKRCEGLFYYYFIFYMAVDISVLT